MAASVSVPREELLLNEVCGGSSSSKYTSIKQNRYDEEPSVKCATTINRLSYNRFS
jgi:hypothetical protein